MRQLIRRLSRVSDSSAPELRRRAGKAAAGHVPVDVGDEMERFEVPAELLGRPAFAELLRLSAAEYGYEQRGVIRIPCSVAMFRRVVSVDGVSVEEVEEMLRSSGDGEE